MFPLKSRVIGGYKFRQATSYSSAHLGVDYRANYVPIYAPFNGTATTSTGTQGGKTISFKPDGRDVMMRFMHLSEMKSGHFNQGDQIGVTGNTGSLSSAPHLHLDIATNWGGTYWNNINNFIDPETYDWGQGDNMEWYRAENESNVYKYDPDFDLYYGVNDPNKVPWSEVKPSRPAGTEYVPKGSEVRVEIKEVEKRVEVPVEKIVEKPVIVEKEVVRDLTLGEALSFVFKVIWNKIKGIKE